MAIKDVVEYKLNRLVDLMLTDGVAPSDIADNIFMDNYDCITYKKTDRGVMGEVVLHESNAETYIIRYYYNMHKRIERIEEDKQGVIEALWDRDEIVEELLYDLVILLKTHYTPDNVMRFINSLPKELYDKLYPRIDWVA